MRCAGEKRGGEAVSSKEKRQSTLGWVGGTRSRVQAFTGPPRQPREGAAAHRVVQNTTFSSITAPKQQQGREQRLGRFRPQYTGLFAVTLPAGGMPAGATAAALSPRCAQLRARSDSLRSLCAHRKRARQDSGQPSTSRRNPLSCSAWGGGSKERRAENVAGEFFVDKRRGAAHKRRPGLPPAHCCRQGSESAHGPPPGSASRSAAYHHIYHALGAPQEAPRCRACCSAPHHLTPRTFRRSTPQPPPPSRSCIDCDVCRWLCPSVFSRRNGLSAVHAQPHAPEDRLRALQALVSCPTNSIRTEAPPKDIAAAHDSFPVRGPAEQQPLAHLVRPPEALGSRWAPAAGERPFPGPESSTSSPPRPAPRRP